MSITGQEITYEALKEETASFEGRDFAQWMIDNIESGVEKREPNKCIDDTKLGAKNKGEGRK